MAPTEALDMIMDPNKKEREEEESLRKEVKQSKKQWRNIRQQRFAFLDSNLPKRDQSTTVGQSAGQSATEVKSKQ
jgi:oligoribonuclease (3'-5' exoribonuclease)